MPELQIFSSSTYGYAQLVCYKGNSNRSIRNPYNIFVYLLHIMIPIALMGSHPWISTWCSQNPQVKSIRSPTISVKYIWTTSSATALIWILLLLKNSIELKRNLDTLFWIYKMTHKSLKVKKGQIYDSVYCTIFLLHCTFNMAYLIAICQMKNSTLYQRLIV